MVPVPLEIVALVLNCIGLLKVIFPVTEVGVVVEDVP
jgi:hypothetical protein